MKFTAYFDKSATRDRTVTTVAGFVSRTDKWNRFENEWRTLLPSTVTMFHMTDFVSCRKGWESWRGHENSARRVAFIESMVRCIRQETNKGFTLSVRERDFANVNREYKLYERFRNSYVFLGIACLGRLAAWAVKKRISIRDIDCIFEDGDEGRGWLLDMARGDGFNVRLRSKHDVRAFDACDLAAWKSRAVIDDALERRIIKDQMTEDQLWKSTDLIERLIKSDGDFGMFSATAIVKACQGVGVSKR